MHITSRTLEDFVFQMQNRLPVPFCRRLIPESRRKPRGPAGEASGEELGHAISHWT